MTTRVYHRLILRPANAPALKRNLQRHDHCGRRWLFQLRVNAVTVGAKTSRATTGGPFVYLRDVRSGAVWSGFQPVHKPQTYEVAFSEDKADFWRTDAGIVTHPRNRGFSRGQR
jgi:hypothetical protein